MGRHFSRPHPCCWVGIWSSRVDKGRPTDDGTVPHGAGLASLSTAEADRMPSPDNIALHWVEQDGWEDGEQDGKVADGRVVNLLNWHSTRHSSCWIQLAGLLLRRCRGMVCDANLVRYARETRRLDGNASLADNPSCAMPPCRVPCEQVFDGSPASGQRFPARRARLARA